MKSLTLILMMLNFLSCSTDQNSKLNSDEVNNFSQIYPRNMGSGIQEARGDDQLKINYAYQHNLGDWTQASVFVAQFQVPNYDASKKIVVDMDGATSVASFEPIAQNNNRGVHARYLGQAGNESSFSIVVYAQKGWGNKTFELSVFQNNKKLSKEIKIGKPLKPNPSSAYTVSVSAGNPMIEASAYVTEIGDEQSLVIDASVQSLSYDKLFVFRDSEVVQRTMQPVWSRESILKSETGSFSGWKSDTVRYLGRSNGRENFRIYVSNFNHRHGPIVQRTAYQLDYVVDPTVEIDSRMNTRKIVGETGSLKITVGVGG